MIYITGDVHGDVDFEKLIQLRSNNVSLNDTLIILGDAGICWSPEFTKNLISLYRKLNISVIFLVSKRDIIVLLPDVSITTIEKVLSTMLKEEKIKKIGSTNNCKYYRSY